MSTRSAPHEIRFTNSMTGKKELFVPQVPGKVAMYSCGPTVYALIHIGNLRAGLVSDLIFRVLRKFGYDVTYVRNYTDVDDKIINRAKEENTTTDAITKKYTQEVERDYALALMLEPTHKTSVTTHIPEIVELIEEIIRNGKAYVVQGEVFFAIDRFAGYGKLSKRNIEDLVAGARVEIDSKKHNPLDFSLWKPAKPGEPFWPSPWGNGRPGWHIECSAMARKWLGDQIDLHHGGEDLIFPHHENEIAQTESATGKAPFVRTWIHNGFLNINHEKMSKSVGNTLSARDFLSQYPAELIRYLFFSTHYRSVIDYSDESIENATSGLERIYEAKKRAREILTQKPYLQDMLQESAWGSFVADCELTKKKITEELANDLNVAGAMGAVFTLIREYNRLLGEPRASTTPSALLGSDQLIRLLEDELGEATGIGRAEPIKFLEALNQVRARRAGEGGGSDARLTPQAIADLIQERVEAKQAKNFARADEIRKSLDEKGIILKDGPSGTVWSYR